MTKLILLVAAWAFVHVARPDDTQNAPPPPKSDSCNANGQTYQPGDRICADESTHRVCNWGGEWVDDKCPAGFKCQALDANKVQCFQLNRNSQPYPTGPPAGVENSEAQPAQVRVRRQDKGDAPPPTKSDSCSANGQTYQPGDRYCVDDTTHRVCNWGGEWVEDKCPSGSKCQTSPSDNRKVRCFQYIANPYPTGPPPGFNSGEARPGSRRVRRQDKGDAPPPSKSDACSANGQTYQPGDRYCVDETTHRVCNWGGEWVEDKCPPEFKCQPLASDSRRVQCFQLRRNPIPYPTGPPPGSENSEVQPQPQPNPPQTVADVQPNHRRH